MMTVLSFEIITGSISHVYVAYRVNQQ